MISLIFSLIFSTKLISQNNFDRVKAEKSVTTYMVSKSKVYKSISFGELFDQTYPKEIASVLKTKKQIVYSIIHTYSLGKMKYSNVYFHLDKDYGVIGSLSDEEMSKIQNEILEKSGKMDSIMKTIVIPK